MTTGWDSWSKQSSRRRRWRLHIVVSVLALKLIRPLSLSLPPPLRYRGNHLSLWKIWINAHCTSFVASQNPFVSQPAAFQLYTLLLHPTFSHALFTLTSLPLFSLSHFSPRIVYRFLFYCKDVTSSRLYALKSLWSQPVWHQQYSSFTSSIVVYKTHHLPPLASPLFPCALCEVCRDTERGENWESKYRAVLSEDLRAVMGRH